MAGACVHLNDPATAMNASGAGRHGWAPTNSANLYGGDGGVHACARECVCARTCVMCLQYTIKKIGPG